MVPPRLRYLPAHLGNGLAGLLLAFYTYVYFAGIPYVGFNWDPGSGRVMAVSDDGPVHNNDRLVQVGGVTFEAFRANQRQRLFQDAQPGQPLPLIVSRAGELIPVSVRVAATPSQADLWGRASSQWFLAWIFWLFGTLTLAFVRPRDNRWRLLITFNALMAVNLITSVAARDHAAESAIVGRMAIWLSAPVAWHLHWIFPQPLRRVPRGVWAALHAAASLMAVLEWFRAPPAWLYQAALLAALLGIFIPLIARLFVRGQSRLARYLWGLSVLAILPTILLGVASLLLPDEAELYGFLGVLFGWPALPAMYFFAAYRRQLGDLETRTSRAISLYLYAVAFVAALSLVLPLVDARWPFQTSPVLAATLAAVGGGLAAIWLYAPFQQAVDRYLLGVRHQPAQLLAAYSTRLTASSDRGHLVRLLRDELLPSLLVRQSTLISLEAAGALTALYRERVDQLLDEHELQALVAEADRYRLPPELTDRPVICPWVRVALPLRRDGQLVGVWLLGRRDPDDYYSHPEIASLRALADQTAIALAHLQQTERLRQLLQANVDRDEQERGQWALNLHDEILNELALLAPGAGQPAEMVTAYQRVVARVRQMISGLRPAMLAYGLHRALEQLADDLADRAGEAVQVQVDIVGDARYPLPVEQHLFRIIQQASENALKHAQARTLRLEASLQAEHVELRVEDDGQGLPPGVQDDLAGLIAKRHFGLAGMFERAAFIGADLRLSSRPGRGTRILATWRAPAREAPG